ncbi:MAG: hypothetical protein LBN05_03000 [Oscillospiraceae bacterium]|jgi:hypothetical protein|nr:hypothetical protein [Oscillospiraceae bacterium]
MRKEDEEMTMEMNNTGTMMDLWTTYCAEVQAQLARIARARHKMQDLRGAQAYQMRGQVMAMYRRLEELQDVERELRCYYRFTGQSLSEHEQQRAQAMRRSA